MADTDFSGVWLSSYSFYHEERDFHGRSEHYVRIFKNGDSIVIETVPGLNAAYLILRLHLVGDLATGSWQEETSPTGYFKGAIFSGAVQLKLSDDRRSMKGKWVAFTANSKGEIVSNDWEITYLGAELAKDIPPIQTERSDESFPEEK